ncbi:MAG: XRE family transcriptional regulator [Bacteroidia bacterium]
MAKKPYIKEIVLQKVGAKLKQMRIDAGYTSYENFALDNDLDRKQYWRAESGSNLTLSSIILILNKHKISLNTFFEDL